MGKTALHLENPPLVEMVGAVFFERLSGYSTVHPGIVWGKFREEYPTFQDQPPLHWVPELLQFSPLPPMRRVQFISGDNTKILQIQDNAFLYNWRKNDGSIYPGFIQVKQELLKCFETFSSVINDEKCGEINIAGFELTYTNHLREGIDWENPKALGEALPAFSSIFKRPLDGSDMKGMQLGISYPMQKSLGDLVVKIQLAVDAESNKQIFLLELTTRYIGKAYQPAEWMDQIHEKLRSCFKDITSESIRKKWGQT